MKGDKQLQKVKLQEKITLCLFEFELQAWHSAEELVSMVEGDLKTCNEGASNGA